MNSVEAAKFGLVVDKAMTEALGQELQQLGRYLRPSMTDNAESHIASGAYPILFSRLQMCKEVGPERSGKLLDVIINTLDGLQKRQGRIQKKDFTREQKRAVEHKIRQFVRGREADLGSPDDAPLVTTGDAVSQFLVPVIDFIAVPRRMSEDAEACVLALESATFDAIRDAMATTIQEMANDFGYTDYSEAVTGISEHWEKTFQSAKEVALIEITVLGEAGAPLAEIEAKMASFFDDYRMDITVGQLDTLLR
ncbi:MAG: hypothetical protein ACI9BD_001325 [Candidatus Marinamargulisbacteria bacterium]|jgi:hypothetical protein